MRAGDTRRLLAVLALALTAGGLGGLVLGAGWADPTAPMVLLAVGCGLGAVVGPPEDHDGR